MKTAGKKSAIVLAAGRSSRMGRSKLRLSLGTQTVLERVVHAFTQAAVEDKGSGAKKSAKAAKKGGAKKKGKGKR